MKTIIFYVIIVCDNHRESHAANSSEVHICDVVTKCRKVNFKARKKIKVNLCLHEFEWRDRRACQRDKK